MSKRSKKVLYKKGIHKVVDFLWKVLAVEGILFEIYTVFLYVIEKISYEKQTEWDIWCSHITAILIGSAACLCVIDYYLWNHRRATLYVDMDGTLAKWNSNVDLDYVSDPKNRYFRSLQGMENMLKAIQSLAEEGYDVRILTKSPSKQAAADKRLWLREHGLKSVPVIIVPYEERKEDYVKGGVLLDDYSENLKEWESSSRCPWNIGIKVYNGINGTKGSWKGYSVNSEDCSQKIKNTVLNIMKTQGAW